MDPEFMARDVASYTTERERAAYRAGMSTAAAICDDFGRDVVSANTKRGRLSKSGAALAAVAKACGDRIWAARETIKVRESENV